MTANAEMLTKMQDLLWKATDEELGLFEAMLITELNKRLAAFVEVNRYD